MATDAEVFADVHPAESWPELIRFLMSEFGPGHELDTFEYSRTLQIDCSKFNRQIERSKA